MTRVQVELPVRFRDTDTMGHVNNAVYLSYLEQCRIGYFDQRLARKWDWKEFGIILARNEIDYLAPVFLQDRLYADVWVSRIGNSSFDFSYELHTEHDSGTRLVTRARSILVCFDFSTNEKQPLYPAWRELFAT